MNLAGVQQILSSLLHFRTFRDERLRLPDNLNYDQIGGLSNEVREKLKAARPATLGQAARLEGVTPGALMAVLAFVRKRHAA